MSMEARRLVKTRMNVPPARAPGSLSASANFDLHPATSPERRAIENFIAGRFHAVYGASIHDFMPDLLTMSLLGQLDSVVGVRAAKYHSLFLEQYFTDPIDQKIGGLIGSPVHRAAVIEIGNLAGLRCRSSQLLFVVLTAILHEAGIEWTVFTATPVVEKLVGSLGIQLYSLGHASSASLTETDQLDWGSYYACKPQVVLGHVSSAMAALNSGEKTGSALLRYRDDIATLGSELTDKVLNGQYSRTA